MSQLTAASLYALANGGRNEGVEQCYWCGSPCQRVWKHEEPDPQPFQKRTTLARRPSSPYICFGCWRFSWKRCTLNFISGGYQDGRCATDHSLWITESGVWGIRAHDQQDCEELYKLLLKPPLRFCLMLRDGDKIKNMLGLALANDHVQGVQASTVLQFTINNIKHEYTPYDLEEGLRNGVQGKPPGVQALVRMLGEYKLPAKENARVEKITASGGRPKPLEDGRQLQKVVVERSGG